MEIPEERADNRAISAKEMLPSRLYFYIYRDRGTREIACSYLDVIAQPECCQAVLYYDLAPGEPKKTNRIYMGDAFVTDTTFSFLVTNYKTDWIRCILPPAALISIEMTALSVFGLD